MRSSTTAVCIKLLTAELGNPKRCDYETCLFVTAFPPNDHAEPTLDQLGESYVQARAFVVAAASQRDVFGIILHTSQLVAQLRLRGWMNDSVIGAAKHHASSGGHRRPQADLLELSIEAADDDQRGEEHRHHDRGNEPRSQSCRALVADPSGPQLGGPALVIPSRHSRVLVTCMRFGILGHLIPPCDRHRLQRRKSFARRQPLLVTKRSWALTAAKGSIVSRERRSTNFRSALSGRSLRASCRVML